MRDRRERGLCYYCEDKWSPGYKCKTPKTFLPKGLEEEEIEGEAIFHNEDTNEESNRSKTIDISLLTISGTLTPKTMRLMGYIEYQKVTVLIYTNITQFCESKCGKACQAVNAHKSKHDNTGG